MSAPDPRSALAGAWRRGRFGSAGSEPLRLEERHPEIVEIAAFSHRHGEADTALAAAVGIGLPESGYARSAGDIAALWTAPARCLVLRTRQTEGSLYTVLARASVGLAACVDQTHAMTVLRLSGPRCREVLDKGCRIDLHPRAFGPGRTAVTPIADVTAILHQTDVVPTFDLMVPATFAESFLHWLMVSAAEFGVDLL